MNSIHASAIFPDVISFSLSRTISPLRDRSQSATLVSNQRSSISFHPTSTVQTVLEAKVILQPLKMGDIAPINPPHQPSSILTHTLQNRKDKSPNSSTDLQPTVFTFKVNINAPGWTI